MVWYVKLYLVVRIVEYEIIAYLVCHGDLLDVMFKILQRASGVLTKKPKYYMKPLIVDV